MTANCRRRITLGLAVVSGVLGSGLAGVGGVGLAAAAGTPTATPTATPATATLPVLDWELNPAPPASYGNAPPPVVNAPGQIPLPTNVPLPTPPAKPVTGGVVQGGAITRDQVIARAVTWVLQAVPYSQTSWWTDKNGTYRQDCSGYVSMAWALDQRTNYWTGNLATVSHRIASGALKPGDVLLLPRHHVVLFAGWANSARTKFNLYEEYSRGKPARYLVNASLSYYLDHGYGAYRYDKIRDSAVTTEMEMASTSVPNGVEAVAWTADLAAQAESETVAPLSLEATRSGTAMVLLAAGLGLLFISFPLTIAARTPALRRPEEST